MIHTDDHPEAPDTSATHDDLQWANIEIQQAQRQITRGISELAEGIVRLSLVLHDVRQRRLYRFDPDCPTFAAFVEQRHGISAHHANRYVEALRALGPQQYHTLLSDVGVQRTYALAMLQQTDPALVAAFQQLPSDERRAITVAQLEAVDSSVTNELRARVQQLEQEITREQGLHSQARRRLQEVEELHQRVTSNLIEERDHARHALDQEQSQLERLRSLVAEARQRTSTVATAPSNAPALPPPVSAASPPTETVVVVVAYDLSALVSDLRAINDKLERLAHIRRDDLPIEQWSAVKQTMQTVRTTIQTLLSAPENGAHHADP